MGTPSKSQIYRKAVELWTQDCYRNGSIDLTDKTPEYSELLENGFISSAQSLLMCSDTASMYGVVTNKEEKHSAKSEKQQVVSLDDHFLVDIEELLRSGCFICGGKGTTKSNLAKIIANKLVKLGYVIKVFDISRAWLQSSVPFYVEVENCSILNVDIYQSMVYDLSLLVPNKANRFVSQTLAQDWNRQIATPEYERKWIVYIFEEVQVVIPQGHLRSSEAQQLLRLLTSGRNYQFSAIAITQRAVLTDTSVFELCFQKYFARMDGENDLRKAAAYIGNKAYELEGLKLGEFIYDMGNTTKKISTKEFKPKTLPTRLENLPPPQPQEIAPHAHHDNTGKTLGSIIIAGMWILAILTAVATMP